MHFSEVRPLLIIADHRQRFFKKEGEKILNFTFFSNPLFIIGTVGFSFFKSTSVGIYLFISHLIGNILTGIVFKNFNSLKKVSKSFHKNTNLNFFTILSKSIKESIETLMNIFSILTFFLIIINFIFKNPNSFFEILVSGIIEMTSGLKYLSLSNLPLNIKLYTSVFFLSFGGLAIHFQIFSILNKGSNIKEETLKITFNEGKNMRGIAKIIDENTVNNYEDVFNLLEDKEYIKSLINEYWFLEDVILDENIYYPLEGYLAPNTYEFKMDASTKDIFKKMLDQTQIILDEYKTKIDSSGYNVHEILTLASMVENEGVTLDDRKNIAGVFINRLNANMSLGSDVTTYYAFKIDLGERDLKVSEINSDNPYNTRSSTNAGKLPIGPICNPSKEAIISSIEYSKNNYYYFVADKNMKVYFSENSSEHTRIIKELKSKNLWYEY